MTNFSKILNFQNNLAQGKEAMAKTFAGQLFKSSPWFFHQLKNNELQEQNSEAIKIEVTEEIIAPEEKTIGQVVDQMVDYVHTKASEENTETVTLTNGQALVGKSANTQTESKEIEPVESPQDLVVDKETPHAKVAFVGEIPKDFNSDHPNIDLLSKMIGAMKLEEGSWQRLFLEKSLEEEALKHQEDSLFMHLHQSEVKVVVSLGAFATNLLMGKRERLSKVHGQLQKLNLNSGDITKELSVFPVFHPDLLQINPNMKRSAWIDLQKVMEFLNQ
ncbi:MAG: hypothetical protein GY909_04390 [Oligoflexia bacterium]|nr:hypothetical protein [Oligoflexia bacterium]